MVLNLLFRLKLIVLLTMAIRGLDIILYPYLNFDYLVAMCQEATATRQVMVHGFFSTVLAYLKNLCIGV